MLRGSVDELDLRLEVKDALVLGLSRGLRGCRSLVGAFGPFEHHLHPQMIEGLLPQLLHHLQSDGGVGGCLVVGSGSW